VVEKIDVFVCNPNAGIDRELSAVYVEFDAMDRSGALTGAKHAVAMTASQAMILMQLLQHLQQKFLLPTAATEDIVERKIPPKPEP
jgi:hypothetical protein